MNGHPTMVFMTRMTAQVTLNLLLKDASNMRKIMSKIYKHRKRVLIFACLFVIAGIILIRFLFQNRLESCQKVFTMTDSWSLNQPGIYLDDDFYLNSCETNSFDCSDFCTQEDAQKIYNECKGSGGTGMEYVDDINHLDANSDGVACESLP